MKNLFDVADLDLPLQAESIAEILKTDSVRIERIVSTGQSSPKDFWYDQPKNEWVCILQGNATLSIQNKQGNITTQTLSKGDYINLPPHTKHRVDYTDINEVTIWLAVFY